MFGRCGVFCGQCPTFREDIQNLAKKLKIYVKGNDWVDELGIFDYNNNNNNTVKDKGFDAYIKEETKKAKQGVTFLDYRTESYLFRLPNILKSHYMLFYIFTSYFLN